MKKIIKLKESEILDVIDKIINEQNSAGQPIVVSASNSIGQYPTFDGLKTLFKDLKTNVEKALRGAKPYKISSESQIIAAPKKEGSALKMEVTLVPCKEVERDWYFDSSVAIYSTINTGTPSEEILKKRVSDRNNEKIQGFTGSQNKHRILGRNTIGLSGFKNLDPNAPDKIFTLYVMYSAALKPEGYAEVGDDQPEEPKSQNKTEVVPTTETKPKKELNEVVSGNYTASNCDELHAFQGTSGKVIGNMNVVVGERLQKLYSEGHNPRVMSVDVEVNDMTVKWSCTINESPDGKAWVGFTSRGAGCDNNVKDRAESATSGNDMGSAKKRIMEVYKEAEIEIQKADEVNYTNPGNSFRQIFYVYTKPGKFPPHK